MRLVLQQSLIIVAAGAIVGTGLSVVALRLLQSFDLGATVTPFTSNAHLDGSVLAATVLITLLAGVAAGTLPIWFTRDSEIDDTLRSASRSATLSRGAIAWQKAMLSVAATLPCALRAMRVDIRRGIGGS